MLQGKVASDCEVGWAEWKERSRSHLSKLNVLRKGRSHFNKGDCRAQQKAEGWMAALGLGQPMGYCRTWRLRKVELLFFTDYRECISRRKIQQPCIFSFQTSVKQHIDLNSWWSVSLREGGFWPLFALVWLSFWFERSLHSFAWDEHIPFSLEFRAGVFFPPCTSSQIELYCGYIFTASTCLHFWYFYPMVN